MKGQALSPEDITDKERQVSGVVQPNTLDKWKYTESSYLAIKHIFPWQMELTPLSQQICFSGSQDLQTCPRNKVKSVLIMMRIEGRGPPTLIWWHESNFMYLITVKIGYTVDGV